ncbi:MAG: PIN domain-containing protein [Candidatus Heimdallarchaeota archaeon]
MRVLLDSTYFFSLIGVRIISSGDLLQTLLAQPIEIHLANITLFELSAKGAHFTMKGQLNPKQVIEGINSILYDKRLHQDSVLDSDILRFAFEIRKLHSDFIDCLILACAIENADLLLTEDGKIHKLVQQNKLMREILNEENESFETLSGERFLHSKL